MKKENFAKLALMGLASALVVAAPAVADSHNATEGTYLAAGCGAGKCGTPRGYIAEEPTNTRPVNSTNPRTQQAVDLEPPAYQPQGQPQGQYYQQQGQQYYQQQPQGACGAQNRPQNSGYAPQSRGAGCAQYRGQTAQSSCATQNPNRR